MRGPSIPTGNSTTRCPGEWQKLLSLPDGNLASPGEDGGTHRLVLEGGSIDTNGAGHPAHDRRVPAERSAAAQSRGEPRADWNAFHDYLGIDQVIWLDRGIVGDDTHGHVDDITRFVGPSTIVTVS